jgi:ATP-binding cassette subfamily B protein
VSAPPRPAPFRAARATLNQRPTALWLAVLSSVASSLCAVALLPVGYLALDLLATHGRVANYSDLPGPLQAEFRDRWAEVGQRPEVTERLAARKVPPLAAKPTAADWEVRHALAVRDDLGRLVGPAAADAYGEDAASPDLGVLATVARERYHAGGRVLAWFAAWNPWAWRPGDGRSPNATYLTGLLLIALALVLLRGLFLNVHAYCSVTAVTAAGTRMRRSLYTHAQRLSLVAVRRSEQEHVGALVADKVAVIQEGLTASLAGTVRGPLLAVVLVVFMLLANVWLAVALLAASGLVWLVAGQAAAYFRRGARVSERRVESRLAIMRESFATLTLSKAYLMDRFSQTRFERLLSDLGKAAQRRRRGETFSRPTLLTVVTASVVLLAYFAGRVCLAGGLTVAGLAFEFGTLAVLVYSLTRWTAALARVRAATDAAAEVYAVLDRRSDAAQAVDAEFLQPLKKTLELHDVSLREPGTGRMVLENVNIAIPAGTTAAVVAADPAEARAVAHLLTRFADPTSGEVRVDGKNARWVTAESVRTQIALVLEDSLTFTDTVANNIGCGDHGFSLPRIIEAAKVAHAHQFIQRLPYGYETPIGGPGHALTVGERFRVALARAILRDPSVLVIEEPSESLDADSLVLIDDTLARVRPGRTVVFLARRMATVMSADHVFVLTAGHLAASGKHEDLLKDSDLYRLLHLKHSLAAGTV